MFKKAIYLSLCLSLTTQALFAADEANEKKYDLLFAPNGNLVAKQINSIAADRERSPSPILVSDLLGTEDDGIPVILDATDSAIAAELSALVMSSDSFKPITVTVKPEDEFLAENFPPHIRVQHPEETTDKSRSSSPIPVYKLKTKSPYRQYYDNLNAQNRKKLDAAIDDFVYSGRTTEGHSLGGGLMELTSYTDNGRRIYYSILDGTLILLGGGNKTSDREQQKDIDAAKKLLKKYQDKKKVKKAKK